MIRSLVIVILLLGGLACERRGPESADLAVTHAVVIDVRDGSLRRDQTIFVKDQRIIGVHPSASAAVPSGATIMDADGLFVMPGLWDAHVHSASSAAWHLPMLLAHGVTSVRHMHSTVDTALALTNALKRALASGALLGPRLLANGPIIDGDPPARPGTMIARNPDEGRAAVDSLAAGGADFIKVYDALSRETYFAIADQARRRGIPLDGHMPMLVPPEEGAVAGTRTVEHLGGIAMGRTPVADSLRAEFTALRNASPGLPFPENMLAVFALGREWTAIASDPLTARITALMEPVAATSQAIFRLLHEAGVAILARTDLGNPFLVPGASLHDELALLVDAGLTPLEALQAATLNPARVLGLSDTLGVVEQGKFADLVLLRDNPLDDIRNIRSIEGVVIGGRYLDPRALDEMRKAGRATDQ